MPAKIIKRKNRRTNRKINVGPLAALVLGVMAMGSSFGFSSAYAILQTQKPTALILAEGTRGQESLQQTSSEAVLGEALEFCGCCQIAGELVLASTGNTTLCSMMDSKSECEYLGGNCLEQYSCSQGIRCEPVL